MVARDAGPPGPPRVGPGHCHGGTIRFFAGADNGAWQRVRDLDSAMVDSCSCAALRIPVPAPGGPSRAPSEPTCRLSDSDWGTATESQPWQPSLGRLPVVPVSDAGTILHGMRNAFEGSTLTARLVQAMAIRFGTSIHGFWAGRGPDSREIKIKPCSCEN